MIHGKACGGAPTVVVLEVPTMPVYDYACLECGKEFTIVLSLREHDEKRVVACPECKSHRVESLVSTCEVITSKKS
jgi:putative FmdB family regulatory protein